MKDIPVADVRNLAIFGHTSSGKTTLVDALLFKLGVNDRLGLVANGSSVADYTDEEKNRRITIFAKTFDTVYKTAAGRKMHLVLTDTPGYLDFYGQVISTTHSIESGLVAVDAVAGVQVGTLRVWKCLEKRGIKPRGIVITGLDKENADFDKTLAAIQEKMGAQCVPVTIPLPDRSGVVDVLATPAPAAVAVEVELARGSLVERAAETNDALMEKFFAAGTLTPEDLEQGLVAAVVRGSLVPVFACMPLKALGLNELLEGLARFFPSPEACPAVDLQNNPIKTDPGAPFVGFVHRVVNDPFTGQLTYVRVLGGTLKPDMEVQNAVKHSKEKIGSLLITNGRKQTPTDVAHAGDIVAIPKLKDTGAGDTLYTGASVQMPPMEFPKPVAFQAVRAKTQADEDKLRQAIHRVCAEDPTLHAERNTETVELVLKGLGDVHIDVTVGLMKSRSNVEVTLSVPKVPYRETVMTRAEGHYKHKKQSGGRGQFGEVYMRLEPKRADEPEWFVDAVVGGVIPGNFLPAIQKGFVEAMQKGPLAGCHVVDVKATVYDGSYHDVDSSEIAFKIAGGRALKDAMLKAKPVLLEPIMTVRVMVPDHFMGDANGDLNHKRGRILGMEPGDGMQVIIAEVPQAELFRYAAELRSMTGGQGTFEMEFARYDVVPSNVAQKVIAEAAKDKQEEKDE